MGVILDRIRKAGPYCVPGGSVVKNPPANAGDTRASGLIPVSGRSPEEENGNSLQYSCLENPMDERAWQVQSMGSQRMERNLTFRHPTDLT